MPKSLFLKVLKYGLENAHVWAATCRHWLYRECLRGVCRNSNRLNQKCSTCHLLPRGVSSGAIIQQRTAKDDVFKMLYLAMHTSQQHGVWTGKLFGICAVLCVATRFSQPEAPTEEIPFHFIPGVSKTQYRASQEDLPPTAPHGV